MSTRERTGSGPSHRARWFTAVGVLLAVAGGVAFQMTRTHGEIAAFVGSDLHAVAQQRDRVFVSGHDGAAYSDSPGIWTPIDSLAGKDAMAWSLGTNDIVVGGHAGVFRSTDNGTTFTPVSGLPATDVHAVGAAGAAAYFASPTGGLYSSKDNGDTWNPVGATGESFMGTLLVDPQDPLRVMAADTLQGVVQTDDGGHTWHVLGGIEGPVGLNWNPANHQQIVVTAPGDAAISLDGGTSWLALPIPPGTGAVSFDSLGRVLASVRNGESAAVVESGDLGQTWVGR